MNRNVVAVALMASLAAHAEDLTPPPLLGSAATAHAPPPPGAPETRRLWPLMIAGPATTWAGWMFSIFDYFLALNCQVKGLDWIPVPVCTGTSLWMLVPVIGPWAGLITGEIRDANIAPAVALGLVQAFGISVLIAGATIKIPVSKEVGTIEIHPTQVTF
jgi:hypothetical protein